MYSVTNELEIGSCWTVMAGSNHMTEKLTESCFFNQRRRGRRKWRKEQESWFGEGCHESSEMESGNWRDCCQSGVNPANPVYGINPPFTG